MFHVNPKQCKKYIPFTLARRNCAIVENNEVRKKRLDELQKNLFSHEYPQNLIQKAIRKLTIIPFENVRPSKAKTNSNNLAFFTTFNPNNKNALFLIQAVRCYNNSNHIKQNNFSKILG